MKVRKTFRKWADQWPEESRWILWAWSICLLAVLLFGAKAFWKWNRARPERESAAARPLPPSAPPRVMAPDRPAWIAHAQQAARDFPADPDLWLAAARLLRGLDPAAGRELERDARVLLPLAPAAGRTDFQSPAPAEPGAEANLARASAESAPGALDYSGWLMVQGKWREAGVWLDSLPREIAARPELVSRHATLHAVRRQKDELAQALAAGAWGRINADAVALALASGLATQREQPALARDLWRVAQTAAGQDRESQAVLLRLAVSLGWREQAEQSFDGLLARGGRAWAARYAVWAHQQENPLLWQRALHLWREADAPAAAAYLAATAAGRAAPPKTTP
ncbi:MAG: hypothetical protein HY302_16700 [Opitutae bacterium]|nr:hypothetical protein [Opitutae bacterium]